MTRIGGVADGIAYDAQQGVGIVRLLEDHGPRAAVPMPRPVLVRPADAVGEIDGLVGDGGLERLVQGAAGSEIVIVDAEAADPVAARQGHLPLERLAQAEVVEAEIGGQMRLVVADIARGGLGDIGPLGEPLAPIKIVLRGGVVLRQVEGDHPGLVQVCQQVRPFFQQFLLVASDELQPLGDRLLVGRDTEVVNDLGLRAVDDAVAAGQQPQAQIHILAVGGHEGLVEQRVADFAAPDQQRRAGAVVDVAGIAEAGLARVGEQPNHNGAAVAVDGAAGFLQPSVRIEDLRTDRRHVGVGVQHRHHRVQRAGQQLGVVVEQQDILAAAGVERRVAVLQEPEIGGLGEVVQVLDGPEACYGGIGRRVVGDDQLVGNLGPRARDRSDAFHRVAQLVIDRDQDGHARLLAARQCELRDLLQRVVEADDIARLDRDRVLLPLAESVEAVPELTVQAGGDRLLDRGISRVLPSPRQREGGQGCVFRRSHATFGVAFGYIMEKRREPGVRHVGVAFQVLFAAEQGAWRESFAVAPQHEVAQSGPDVVNAIELAIIPARVEQRRGLQAKRQARLDEMLEQAGNLVGSVGQLTSVILQIEVWTWVSKVIIQHVA